MNMIQNVTWRALFVAQSLEDTAEQRRHTINRLVLVWEQLEDLKKSLVELEKQTQKYQTREGQWLSEKATLTDRVASLEATLENLKGQVTPLESANRGNR